MARKTVVEIDAELEQLRAEYEEQVARKKKQRAAARATESKRDRAAEKQFKIFVGGMVLEHMMANWRQVDLARLDAYLARYSKALMVARMTEKLDVDEADGRRKEMDRIKRRRKALRKQAGDEAPDYAELADDPEVAEYLAVMDAIAGAAELERARDPRAKAAWQEADALRQQLDAHRRAAEGHDRAELSAGAGRQAGDGAIDGAEDAEAEPQVHAEPSFATYRFRCENCGRAVDFRGLHDSREELDPCRECGGKLLPVKS